MLATVEEIYVKVYVMYVCIVYTVMYHMLPPSGEV